TSPTSRSRGATGTWYSHTQVRVPTCLGDRGLSAKTKTAVASFLEKRCFLEQTQQGELTLRLRISASVTPDRGLPRQGEGLPRQGEGLPRQAEGLPRQAEELVPEPENVVSQARGSVVQAESSVDGAEESEPHAQGVVRRARGLHRDARRRSSRPRGIGLEAEELVPRSQGEVSPARGVSLEPE